MTPKIIGAVFEVTDEDRLTTILENNGYQIRKASPCLWSVKKVKAREKLSPEGTWK